MPKVFSLRVTWGGKIFCIPCEIQVRYWVNSCSVLFLNLKCSILHGHCMTTLGGEWPQLKTIVVGLPPIWLNDYFLFFSMPTWMSYGDPCVAPVWFMKLLSVWSVNNIPRLKKKVADTSNSVVSIKKITLCCYWKHQQKRKVPNHWQKVMPLISFNWTDNAKHNNEYLWSLGVFCSTVHYQSECVLATFPSALDRSMCGFISSSSNVLWNIWWDYLQKLSSLEPLEVSSCRLRNTLIKLIAFMLLVKLLNCVIWNKKRILEDFSGIVAHFSGSSCMARIPQ